MKRPKRPYRGVDPRLPLAGPPNTQDLGFIDTIRGKVDLVKKDVAGLIDRLRYRYTDGVPCSYVGEKVFKPEDATFTVSTERVKSTIFASAPPTSIEASYVVRDSQIHEVPIVMPSPGVFIARYLHVEFYQRIFGRQSIQAGGGDNTLVVDGNDYTGKELWVQIPWGKPFMPGAGDDVRLETGKIHMLSYNELRSWAGDRNATGINLFWNLIDRDSERRFSDGLISGRALLPQSYQNMVDGDLFEFETPWLFERGGRVDFQFELINPILQIAPDQNPFSTVPAGGTFIIEGNLTGPAVAWDDRESGVRSQDVLVRAELHGTKFYDGLDELRRETA